MMTYKLYILIALLLMAGGAWAADQSSGCAAGMGDGLSATRGYTLCLLVETVEAGTADSMVFAVMDFTDNGDDTQYVAIFTMDTDSSPKDLVALSPDSVEAKTTSYVPAMLELSSEALAASTAYWLCITCRGTADNTRWDACVDGGAGSQNTATGTDAWPLEDPSGLAFDTDFYAPNIVLWYTTESGESVSIGARRRKILLGQ